MKTHSIGLIAGLDQVASPALLFDADAIGRNLDRMLRIVGSKPARLRPHIKTHKCAEILALQSEKGIDRVKCATIAEVELAAKAGIADILLAYPTIGPNAGRFVELVARYPEVTFSVVVDSREGVGFLSSAAEASSVVFGVFLDLDCGMHRTGILPGTEAVELVRLIKKDPHLRFAGIHAYDGHIHDSSLEARRSQFEAAIHAVDHILGMLDEAGFVVPSVISGGSPTFAMHAEKASLSNRPWECSPGTTVLWDAGYGAHYPELEFEPAAFLLARIVSHPCSGEGTVCLDLGHKAVSAENPIENRVRFPDLPVERFLSQSEEHLVLQLTNRSSCPVGTTVLGIPYHVCPTVALHQRARIIRDSSVTEVEWEITARDRQLSV